MSNSAVITLIGYLLLTLAATVAALNVYLLQPITLLRRGAEACEDRPSPLPVFGDGLALASLFFLSFSAPPGLLGAVVVVWLLNPMALPWLPLYMWLDMRQECRRSSVGPGHQDSAASEPTTE